MAVNENPRRRVPARAGRLALGTVQFGLPYGIANTGGRVARSEVRDILDVARAGGIDTLDTATAYGDSELILGETGMAGWTIIGKLPPLPENAGDVARWTNDQISGSLSRLQVARLDGLLLHNPSDLLGPFGDRLLGALCAARQDGRCAAIGVSVYGPDMLGPLFDRHRFDIVQAPFNVLDRRIVDSGWSRQLKAAGVALHTRSAFLQGLLLMPPDRRPEKFARWADVWAQWDRAVTESGTSAMQASLGYALQSDIADRVIVGVDSAAQLREIVAAADGPEVALPAWLAAASGDLIDPSTWNSL